jgi:MYXO-CTERM domain-containing protein
MAVGGPTAQPTAPTQKRVRVSDFYVAYAAKGAENEPTKEQYAQMVNLTMNFFKDFLTEKFADSPDIKFLGIEPTLGFTLFGDKAGIPLEQFNIYMDYDFADVVYTAESNPPNGAETFVILRDSISPKYILEYVRAATDTPFITTNEVVFRASTLEGPDNRSAQRDPRSGEVTTTTESSGPITALVASSAAAFLLLLGGIALYRRRSWNEHNYPKEFTDGLYVMDSKTIEGYFSENSVTEMSESQYSSRFPPLQRVAEEGNTTDDDPLQRKAPYRD